MSGQWHEDEYEKHQSGQDNEPPPHLYFHRHQSHVPPFGARHLLDIKPVGVNIGIGRPRGDMGCFSGDAKGAQDDGEDGFKEH